MRLLYKFSDCDWAIVDKTKNVSFTFSNEKYDQIKLIEGGYKYPLGCIYGYCKDFDFGVLRDNCTLKQAYNDYPEYFL